MFGLVIAIHVVACALLILIVLVQQGRGGGLIDSLSSAENIFGTKTSTFLVKATSILAVIFFFTCLSLAFLSIRKGKSLIETSYRPIETVPVTKTPAVTPKTTAAPAPASAAPAATSAPAPLAPSTPPAETSTAPTPPTAPATTPATPATTPSSAAPTIPQIPQNSPANDANK